MSEARGLTKRYGRVLAVDSFGFDVQPGTVSELLGRGGHYAVGRHVAAARDSDWLSAGLLRSATVRQMPAVAGLRLRDDWHMSATASLVVQRASRPL